MISQSKQKQLEEQMKDLGIFESDIQEKFVRSSGKGGQNVNKVSTCVFIKHIPTGIEVKCQKERSQAMNRFFARRILLEKIEKMVLGKESEQEKKRWKIRKQKQKRSKRSKEKMLEKKRIVSKKKEMRKKVEEY